MWWMLAGGAAVALLLATGLFLRRSSTSPAYMSPAYWDERYRRRPATYEWYLSFQDLVDFGLLTLTSAHVSFLGQPLIAVAGLRWLDLGCGNSTLADSVSKALRCQVTSIDISDICISLMKSKYPSKVRYLCMDARDLEFRDESFDVVVDKSTLDAVVSAGSATAKHAAKRIVRQVARVPAHGTDMSVILAKVLVPKGQFLVISVHPWSYWDTIISTASPNLVHCEERAQRVVLAAGRDPILVFLNVFSKGGMQY
ncbi:hypothetical protein ACHHYP_03900 [Achlya hypogyna]|uniref:Methyltransferase type 11 domain-containing protein n=1 Tax=Achlya hypogyna TaxID=1202772 RepID=A0A1V9Z2Q5_ACHHY|nr:hypothetical protein ACHHYP_03900 [Achlya hypogyna]